MVAYRMMELDRTKRWEDASAYDLKTVARLIDLANAVPNHLKLGDIESKQVRDLMLYMSEAVTLGDGG
jgi:hypothetical protein